MAPSKTIDRDNSSEPRAHLRLVHDENHSPILPPQPRLPDTRVPPDDEAGFFLGCGIGKPHVRAAIKAARNNATTIEQELMAACLIEPELYYRRLASEPGLACLDRIDPDEVA